MKLFENGTSCWTIVLPEDAPKLARVAAEEIQSVVEAASGVRLPIAAKAMPPFIKLGDDAPELSGGPFDEDYVIDVAEDRVVISGSGMRGMLYGAYDFLEEQLGARFFTTDTTYVPRRDSLALRPGRRYGRPDIAIRRMPFKSAEGMRFGGRLRFNELSGDPALNDNPEYGRGDYRFAIGHSIPAMVPDVLFIAHPEYFPMIDGARRHGPHHQRCLTNPAVLELTVEAVRRQLRENPMQRTIAVGQADTYPGRPNNCTCPACRAIDEAEGSPMGSLLRFVNAVAERIEPEFPHVMINTLAYRYTRKPPRLTRPRRNVMIVLCSIECCFSHPLDVGCGADYMEGPAGHVGNEAFTRDIEGWAAICNHLMIWDYVTNFAHYVAPHPNLSCLGPNVRFFKAHNAYGVYPEGAHDCRGAELDELKTYMLSRLLWQCNRDEKVDRDEFLIGKLGVAAASVMRAIDLMEKHMKDENIHMSTYHTPDERTFPKELVDELDALFDRAEITASNETAKAYVQRLRMSLRYVKLCLYAPKGENERRRAAETFLSDMARLGIDKLMEGGSMEKSKGRLYEMMGLSFKV